MTLDDFKKFNSLIGRTQQIKSSHFHNYSFQSSWGISTEEPDKALIISVSKNDQLYEKFFYQSNTDVTFQIETLLNWLLEHRVLISEPSQVREYLIRHFALTRILRSTCKLAIDQLGMTSQLALEVYHDPEIDDTYLTLYIRQHRYNLDILERIEGLRAEYEIDLVDSSGWFLVTTDFQPPL